ncbi:hypothetical protein COV93_01380 [Candidatus Woesearchaeota archaeon CG11_big_fil_rev_8_21_14_0_20_43_8]|nr:MAG: hypothetical protein COV93_01380 [Candidatus Woesearchaeota archaeon CG11_big_fil_rev_8_21_14_0_20_43_8]
MANNEIVAGCMVHQIKSLPKEFMDWQIDARKKGVQQLKDKQGMPNFSVHTPVLATTNSFSTRHYNDAFDINLAYKGVGLMVKETYLDDFIDRIDDVNSRNKNEDERLDLLLDLYSDASRIDDTCLTSLEIYGTQTYDNLKMNAKCGLCFNARKSYQVDCVAEMLAPGTKFYRFVNGLHTLFHDHIKPTCAYRFNVIGLMDKSPGIKDRKIL